MFNTFAPDARHQPDVELIPAKTLAFAVLTVDSIKMSQSSGGRYAKLELTIDRGPYERRKIFSLVGDPSDPKNSEKFQQMSLASLQHMLEAAGIFRHDQPATYQAFANATFEQIMAALDGRAVAIAIKIEKGQDGYADKNAVAEFLSPNPASRSFKKWQELTGMAPGAAATPVQGQLAAGGAQAAPAASYAPPAGAHASSAGAAAGAPPAWLQNQQK
jgi:hypothetical protein